LKRVELLLAECYANACIASEIARELGLDARTRHDAKMGRDKVLKKVESLRRRLDRSSFIIAVIDYEEGPMRALIDRNFEFKDVLFDGAVYIGVYKRDKRVLAVVFNPHVEGFLCKVAGRFCREEEQKIIKRGGVDRVCKELSSTHADIGVKQVSRAISSLLENLTQHRRDTQL
jgi:uncharacterized protein (UPF0548 family)